MSLRLLSLIALPLILFAGGCVDVDRDSTEPSESSETSAFEGRAVKGILQGAVVSAYALENGGQRFLADAITDDRGDFSLDLAEQSAPLLVEVTAAGNGTSTMLCDAASGCGGGISFGDPMPLPADFRLTALVSPTDLDRGAVAVTPLTHLAARWARAMPGGVTAQSVQVARAQVAALLDIDADFALQRVPDITDSTALGNADFDHSQHALLAAAFAELATSSGQQVGETLDVYADALINNAGQLPGQGTGGLTDLLQRARDMADHLSGQGAVDQIHTAVETLINGLTGGLSRVPVQGEFDQVAFDRAMVALDDLDHYLGLAGIDESASFLASQAPQVNWLYEPQMLGLLEVSLRTGVATAMLSVLSDYLPVLAQGEDEFDVSSLVGSGDLNAIYNLASRELKVTGTENGQDVNITVSVAPFFAGAPELSYPVDGSIENDVASGELSGTLDIDLYDTNLQPLQDAANNVLLNDGDPQELLDAVVALLPELHARATIAGSGSLAKAGDQDFAFEVNNLSAWGELDMPALQGTSELLSLEITSGELISPEGDRVFSPDGSFHFNGDDGPALGMQVGQDAHLQAYFGTQAFGLPMMTFEADGSLEGVGDLVSEVAGNLQGGDVSDLSLADITGLLAVLDYSVLDLHGTGGITIHDQDSGKRDYRFQLDGTRLDASLPNSPETALSFYLTALNGGYIYAGDTLVATVTFDWQNLGATLYLANGEIRQYLLGPLTDIVDPAILEAFLGFIGRSGA